MLIKLTDEQSEFIKSHASQVKADGSDWYYLPFWFKHVDGNEFEAVSPEQLPNVLIERIKEIRGE